MTWIVLDPMECGRDLVTDHGRLLCLSPKDMTPEYYPALATAKLELFRDHSWVSRRGYVTMHRRGWALSGPTRHWTMVGTAS